MRFTLPSCLAAALLAGATAAFAAPPAAMPPPVAPPVPTTGPGPVRLAPHRAVYDLTLVSSRGMRGVESARGRIAFDLTGNNCEGYTLKFRQVTVTEGSESGSRTTDLRTAHTESGDGRSLRFRNDSLADGQSISTIEGTADRKATGGMNVRLRVPKRETATVPDDAVFPNAHMRELIVAAREGRRLMAMKVYDGSDDGRKVYDTLAVIGDRVTGSPDEALETAARRSDLARIAHWPVVLSYFNQGKGDLVPVYTLSFDLYENGVSRALRLDYGDFVLKGDMVRLELLTDPGACAR